MKPPDVPLDKLFVVVHTGPWMSGPDIEAGPYWDVGDADMAAAKWTREARPDAGKVQVVSVREYIMLVQQYEYTRGRTQD